MAKYRDNLPQLSGKLFLTDGGLETELIFHEGYELPDFAAFVLLEDEDGEAAMGEYYRGYARMAGERGVGFILESPTWRASSDWAAKLEYSLEELVDANRQAILLLAEVRSEFESEASPMVVSGCIGPRGDGYDASVQMSTTDAANYHAMQIATFREAGADMVTAITMNYADEAIGVVRAAHAADMPVVISFTVETDGTLPSGQTLKEAIEQVDAATDNGPSYYMINCAHPSHFDSTLETGAAWTLRIRGLRANASRCSHAELDEAEILDEGNPEEFGGEHAAIIAQHPHINVLGGCCGTDRRHVESIADACSE